MIIVNTQFPFIHSLSDQEILEQAFIEATDEEKRLLQLTAIELSEEHHDARIQRNESKCLLLEHYLSLRLVNLQVDATRRASYVNVLSGILGALLGYAVGVLPKGF